MFDKYYCRLYTSTMNFVKPLESPKTMTLLGTAYSNPNRLTNCFVELLGFWTKANEQVAR